MSDGQCPICGGENFDAEGDCISCIAKTTDDEFRYELEKILDEMSGAPYSWSLAPGRSSPSTSTTRYSTTHIRKR